MWRVSHFLVHANVVSKHSLTSAVSLHYAFSFHPISFSLPSALWSRLSFGCLWWLPITLARRQSLNGGWQFSRFRQSLNRQLIFCDQSLLSISTRNFFIFIFSKMSFWNRKQKLLPYINLFSQSSKEVCNYTYIFLSLRFIKPLLSHRSNNIKNQSGDLWCCHLIFFSSRRLPLLCRLLRPLLRLLRWPSYHCCCFLLFYLFLISLKFLIISSFSDFSLFQPHAFF